MKTTRTSPAKPSANKRFCVWADYIRRVYQHVEASSPQEAYRLAKESGNWDFCDWHDNNSYRLSNEVQNLETEEFIAIDGNSHCKTCGSEIVETINDSNFHGGECGACEYQRYQSQPDLLDACYTALDEIEQWDDVMGGSEDPRTQEAIDALKEATKKAHGKAA